MRKVKVNGYIGSISGDCQEISIVKEKIVCIACAGLNWTYIYLEGGVCVKTKERYEKVLMLIDEA